MKNNVLMPINYLRVLGLGGLVVAFYIIPQGFLAYLHAGDPMFTFEHLKSLFSSQGMLFEKGLVALSSIGVIYYAFEHFKLLFNFTKKSIKNKTTIFEKTLGNNLEVTRFAQPLALAMSVNVMFIVGAMFIPGLSEIFEYLFPLALIALLAIGVWQMKLLTSVIKTMLDPKSLFDYSKNNSFATLLIPFSLAMTSVGLAAPAAMSNILTIQGVSYIASSFFGLLAVVIAFIFTVSSISRISIAGEFDVKAGATSLIMIPIITILSITFARVQHSFIHLDPKSLFFIISTFLMIQIIILTLGLIYMRATNYLEKEVESKSNDNPSVYGLICPGVALSVLLGFIVMFGLKSGIFAVGEPIWFLFFGTFIVTLTATIKTLNKLNSKY